MTINKVILVGRLGADPKIIQNDKIDVATMTLATTEFYRDKKTNERKELTEWHRLVTFNKLKIDNLIKQYLFKGTLVYVEGQLRTRKWADENGKDHYSTEIMIAKINILGSKKQNNPDNKEQQQQEEPFIKLDDEIPF